MDVTCILSAGFETIATVTVLDERAMLAGISVLIGCPCMQAQGCSHRRLFDFLATGAIERDAGCDP
jgi:hypothetical protein